MSIKVMSEVWDHATVSQGTLLVLLALADSADERSRECWPAISSIAAKARLSERQVQRCIVELQSCEIIVGIAAGSGVTSFGNSYAVDALLEFRHNAAAAWTGINFRSNAIMREGMADDRTEPGNTGYARAISLANEQGLSWYSRDPVGAPGSGTQAEVLRFTSSIASPTVLQTLNFSDAGMYFNSRAPGGLDLDADPMFCVDYVAGADNYLGIFPSGPAATPGIAARGDAADIDILFSPKGAGLLRLNTTIGAASAPSAFSAVNFLRIKGAGGSIYYIPLATGAW